MLGRVIVPDTKDWTWVLDRACPDCGLDTSRHQATDVPGLLRANAESWHVLLTGPDATGTAQAGTAEAGAVGRRPSPDVWSPLEYGCHVRDANRIFTQRLRLMLTQDAPEFPYWDQDATAVADHYAEQDRHQVARDILDSARVLAEGFEGVSGVGWERTGSRSDGAYFTVASFARYFIHDPVHHLYDVTGVRAD
jgi:hypothetical protein